MTPTPPFTLTRSDDGGAVLDLVGEVTIEHVRDMHAALCTDAPLPHRIEVRCSEVTRLDAAAVQLLFAAGRAAQSACVVGRGEAWTRAFVRYGVTDPFREAN